MTNVGVFMRMKNFVLLAFILCAGQTSRAQNLTTVTGLRFYEHHSPSIPGMMGANGKQSGYDFVNRNFVPSFNQATFGPHTDGTDTTIDMVEHKGPSGGGGKFGFTSGVSSIWAGDIKGNGTTKWMKAPTGFNFGNVTKTSEVAAAFNPSLATQEITDVDENYFFIGRIRNSNLYVTMRTYNVTNSTGAGDIYFDFDYKWGLLTTGVSDVNKAEALVLYPNPAVSGIVLANTLHLPVNARVLSVTGQEVSNFSMAADELKTLDVSNIHPGLYMVVCTAGDGSRYVQQFVKQ